MNLASRTSLRVATSIWNAQPHGFGLTVVCKATFTLQPELSPLSATQVPVQVEDVVSGPAGALARASELAPFKHLPEVLVTGHAVAPGGKPVTSLVARFAVDGIDRSILVVGDRRFDPAGRLEAPTPFTRMPLVWERAAGGAHTSNPAGRALGAAAPRDAGGCIQAPNLFRPGVVLGSLHDVIEPVGLGPVAPLWPSRAARLGRHAAGWAPERWHARPLPPDIDPSYFNAAPEGQQRSAPFGADRLHLENLHPRAPRLSTRLASVTPAATVDRGAGPEPLALRCDTLIIDADLGAVMLLWRGHLFLDHPEAPARVVVVSAEAPAAPAPSATTPAVSIPAWTHSMPASETLAPGWSRSAPAGALPFAAPPPARSPMGTLPMIESTPPAAAAPPPPGEGPLDGTADLGVRAAPSLPFAAEDAAGDLIAREGTAVLRREGAREYEKRGPAAPRATLSAITSVPTGPAWAAQPGARRPRAFSDVDQEKTTEYVRPPPLFLETQQAFETSGRTIPSPEAPAPAEAPPEPEIEVDPEPELDLDAYSAARCGAIAARLDCDGEAAGEILQVEGLDAASWQVVHGHRLAAIHDQVARGQKALIADYDGAYVQVLEALRGPITVDAYAAIAEAAERGAADRAVADRGLPEGAWPHVHRVWIQRMVRDIRLGKQVRAAIDALRRRGST